MNTTLIQRLLFKNKEIRFNQILRKMCESQATKVKEIKIPVPWGHIAGKLFFVQLLTILKVKILMMVPH